MEVTLQQLQKQIFLNYVIYNESRFLLQDLVSNYDLDAVIITDYIKLENNKLHSVKIKYITQDTNTKLYFFEEEFIELKTLFEDYKVTCYF